MNSNNPDDSSLFAFGKRELDYTEKKALDGAFKKQLSKRQTKISKQKFICFDEIAKNKRCKKECDSCKKFTKTAEQTHYFPPCFSDFIKNDNGEVVCPECMEVRTKDELNQFGGMCQTCTEE